MTATFIISLHFAVFIRQYQTVSFIISLHFAVFIHQYQTGNIYHFFTLYRFYCFISDGKHYHFSTYCSLTNLALISGRQMSTCVNTVSIFLVAITKNDHGISHGRDIHVFLRRYDVLLRLSGSLQVMNK